jgi:type 2 lantibiotic biosynthesis protein LanM
MTAAVDDPAWFPWQLGTGLAERLAAPPAPAPGGGPRYRFWARHLWAQARPEAVAERADAAGLDLDTFRGLLDEDGDALIRRLTGEPGWARAFRTDLEDFAGTTARSGFGNLVAPLVAAAEARLAAAVRDTRLRAALLATMPRERLYQGVLKTLILELNVARVEGRLRGATGEERFADFCEGLCDPARSRAIWAEYPVLARYLRATLDRWVACQREFAERLTADLPALVAAGLLPAEPGPLLRVRADSGDVHRGGRTVALVEFAGGMVVYKPRSLGVDAAFDALVGWFNRHGSGPGLRRLSVVERDGYGWTEFVTADECAGEAAAEAFYTRTGALLALLYLLSAVDFHFENVIAGGDQPVLVDLESLLHQEVSAVTREQGQALDDPVTAFMERSVLNVGLLPTAILIRDANSRRHRVDISGIGGADSQISLVEVALPEDAGTDHARLTRQRPTMTKDVKNIPVLNGKPVDPTRYGDRVADGFAAAYRAIVRHRDSADLLAVLERFRDVPLRAIVRPTQAYGQALSDSLHPDFLRDGLDRLVCLDRLWNGLGGTPNRAEIIESEIGQLLEGDIPLFEFSADGRDLVAADGRRIPDVLADRPYEAMLRRLSTFGGADLERQLSLIRGAYTTLRMDGETWPVFDVPLGDRPASPRSLRDAALGLADRVLDEAVRDGDAIGWVTTSLHDDEHWTLQRASCDLYAGRAGIGLFLGYAGVLAGHERALATARQVADGVVAESARLLADTAARAAREPLRDGELGDLLGGFGAIGGSLYFLAALTRLTGDDRWTGHIGALAGAIARYSGTDVHHDVSAGAGGGILALLGARDLLGDEAVALASAAAENVLARRTVHGGLPAWSSPMGHGNVMLTGFAHGAAGLAYAFAELFAHTGDPRHAQVVRDALTYERAHWSETAGTWRDLREGAQHDTAVRATYWCNGAPGIGLSRLALLRRPELVGRLGLPGGAAALTEELHAAMATTVRRLYTGDRLTGRRTHSLCHGDIGTGAIVEAYARFTGDDELLERTGVVRGAVLDQAAAQGWSCGLPAGTPAPGLMCGHSGIGLGLLSAAHPGRVPDVLLLG